MFKQPETFRATAPGKFLMLAGGTAAREAACHCVRVTSTGREQVWDSVPGPLERDVRLWQTVPSKVWQHVPEGFYLIFLLKRCQQALNHGKKQASQNTHPYQNSSPILEQIQLEEFEKRWVNFGVTSIGVQSQEENQQVPRGPYGHGRLCASLATVQCLGFMPTAEKPQEKNIYSAFRGQSQESGTPELLGVQDHVHPAMGTGKLISSSKIQEYFHQKKKKNSNAGLHAILFGNSHSHFASLNGTNTWWEDVGKFILYAAQMDKLFYLM